MSEMIYYLIRAKGFKSEEEKEKFIELGKSFYDSEVYKDENEVLLSAENGWRGGGLSCKEIIANHFSSWLKSHPYIEFEAIARYIEECPEEVFSREDLII